MPETEVSYPECEKLSRESDKRATLSVFMEVLSERGLVIAEYHKHTDECVTSDEENAEALERDDFPSAYHCGYREDDLYPIHKRIEDLIMDFLGIDQKKLEEERRAMLDAMR